MSATPAAADTNTNTDTTTDAATAAAGQPRKAWQPLHPDVRPRLDPQYVQLHDEVLQYVFPDHEKPWDPAIRLGSPNAPLGLGPVPVGAVETFDLGLFQIRAFTPNTTTQGPSDSPRPDAGWPLFVWFHGGGFALGDLDSDWDVITRICQGRALPLSPQFAMLGFFCVLVESCSRVRFRPRAGASTSKFHHVLDKGLGSSVDHAMFGNWDPNCGNQ